MSRADKFRNGIARGSLVVTPRPKPEPTVIPGGLVQTQLATSEHLQSKPLIGRYKGTGE